MDQYTIISIIIVVGLVAITTSTRQLASVWLYVIVLAALAVAAIAGALLYWEK